MGNKIEFPFYVMPINFLKGKGLSNSDKLIYSILLTYQLENGHCQLSLRDLGKETDASRPTVIKSIRKLEAAKLLTVNRLGPCNNYIVKEPDDE